MVDLERREVVDVLSERSAEATARWLSQYTKVEIVSRDRCGLYAEVYKFLFDLTDGGNWLVDVHASS